MVRLEMGENGCHRIVGETRTGEWAPYQGISVLEEDGKVYIAVTEYFSGLLPTETVLEVTPKEGR